MAAPLHRRMRNVLRKKRYASPLELDADCVDVCLAWAYGDKAECPAFYASEGIISEAGEEWLLQNKALADMFLKDIVSETSGPSVKPGDRYCRLFDDDLKRNSCYPRWPSGAEGIAPPLLWLWAFWYRDSMVWAWRLFWFLVSTHAVEVVLVLLWLQPVGFTITARAAWAVYSFICGWPITGRAKILCGIVLGKNEKKEAARLKKVLAKKNAGLKKD